MKLIIGLPTGGKPTQPFIESLKWLQCPQSFSAIDRIIVTGNFVPGQRELIMRRAVTENADFVLMLDDDMIVPADAIERLFQTIQSNPLNAIAGALYYSRDGKRPMVVSNWSAGDTTDATVPAFTDMTAVQVDGIGFGCVLVRMAALQRLEQPYFSAQIVVETEHSHVRICNEDYLLCERLRHAGYNIMLDARVRSGHFDRDRALVLPEQWESNEITGVERMHVRQLTGVEELVPLSAGNAHVTEEHQHAVLDYLFI